MQSFTLLSNYFRFSKMRSLSIPGMFGGNGSATIVCFEKNHPNWNWQDLVLYLRQVLECMCSCYVVTDLYSWGYSVSCGKTACITLLAMQYTLLYYPSLRLVHELPRGKNEYEGYHEFEIRHEYIVQCFSQSITISLKNTSTQYWKCLATIIGLLLNKLHLAR